MYLQILSTFIQLFLLTLTTSELWKVQIAELISYCTSSGVSTECSMFGFALLANFGATTLDKQICFSGGGPPLGTPLIITASPDKIYKKIDYLLF